MQNHPLPFNGRWRKLTENRRLVLDVCSYSRNIPLFPAERTINLKSLAQLRNNTKTRISWSAIFTKALGIAAIKHAPFRQAYFSLPWPHLYEHGFSVASVAMHRRDGEEDRLCWAKVTHVEVCPLVEIQARLDFHKNEPIHVAFPKQWRLARLPRPLRRLVWAMGLHLLGRERIKCVGTYTVSSLAGQGVYNRFHPTIATSSLSYGPIDDDGDCLVSLICDHRVIDGHRAALCLQDLEMILNDEISKELQQLAGSNQHSEAA